MLSRLLPLPPPLQPSHLSCAPDPTLLCSPYVPQPLGCTLPGLWCAPDFSDWCVCRCRPCHLCRPCRPACAGDLLAKCLNQEGGSDNPGSCSRPQGYSPYRAAAPAWRCDAMIRLRCRNPFVTYTSIPHCAAFPLLACLVTMVVSNKLSASRCEQEVRTDSFIHSFSTQTGRLLLEGGPLWPGQPGPPSPPGACSVLEGCAQR